MPQRSQSIDINRKKSRRYTRKKSGSGLEIESSVAREIWAVIYFALGALTVLSLWGKLGTVGSVWGNFLKPIFGWGVYAFPVILIFLGLSNLFKKENNVGLIKIFGVFSLYIAVLGTFHLILPEDQMFDLAQLGSHGGYIGFVAAFLLKSVLGKIGAQVVFIALFIISVLLTFEISLVSLINFLRPELPVSIERNVKNSKNFRKKLRINKNGEVEEVDEDESDEIDFDK